MEDTPTPPGGTPPYTEFARAIALFFMRFRVFFKLAILGLVLLYFFLFISFSFCSQKPRYSVLLLARIPKKENVAERIHHRRRGADSEVGAESFLTPGLKEEKERRTERQREAWCRKKAPEETCHVHNKHC